MVNLHSNRNCQSRKPAEPRQTETNSKWPTPSNDHDDDEEEDEDDGCLSFIIIMAFGTLKNEFSKIWGPSGYFYTTTA